MILSQNFKFLSKRLKELLENTKEEALEYRINKENIKVPFYQKVSIHSLYNPFGENQNLEYKKDSLIISIGFGAGYHLINLTKKYKEIVAIVFELEIFKSIISNIDLNLFFNENNLKIITCEEILDYYDFFEYQGYQITYPLSYERLFSSILLENIKKIKATLNEKIIDINTQKKFGKIWHKNIFKNIKRIENFDYTPLIIDKPILITGAGFSLIKSIELIKEFRSSLYIAATDTSLKILDSYDITPDSVFTFDCQNFTLQHFLGLKNYNFRLFMDITSNINYNKIKNISLLLSNHPFRNFFTQYQIPLLDSSSGNIGTATIDFFYRYFTQIPIITSGIDYGIYSFTIYPRGSSIKILNNLKSNFLKTNENFDTTILYHYNISEKNREWCTNTLLKGYSDCCSALSFCKKIYTLSDSPYINFIKIENFKKFLENLTIKKQTLEFKKIEFDKDHYEKLKNFLIQNSLALIPYFLSIKKKPDNQLITDLINYSLSLLE